MNKNRMIAFCTITVALFVIASCSISPHPNEKIIVGTWVPVTVEKIVDSSALQAQAALSGGTEQRKSKAGAPAGDGGAARKEEAFNRLVQSEKHTTMEIFANHTAVKNFPGKPMQATWKMKGKGTRIVAKGVENNVKFTIDILEITKEQIIIIEHSPVGDIKITYERQM